MPGKERVYWDSVTFNYRIAERPENIDILRHITDRAERNELEIVTSAFTLCEVAKVEPATGNIPPEAQERLISDFFKNSYIVLVAMDRRVAEVTRRIVRSHSGMKPADATHIASAILAGASVLHTYDKGLLKLDGRIESGLRIEEPRWKDGQPPLVDLSGGD
jgi:predicted nucleic acid-binding protein